VIDPDAVLTLVLGVSVLAFLLGIVLGITITVALG
jgi:hypothetical protein